MDLDAVKVKVVTKRNVGKLCYVLVTMSANQRLSEFDENVVFSLQEIAASHKQVERRKRQAHLISSSRK